VVTLDFERKTKELIDSLKGICASYGLGNDGNEFKIITQVFLYKFLNDKFAYEAKQIEPSLADVEDWEQAFADMNLDDQDMLQMQMSADTARLKPDHFISYLFEQQNTPDFAKRFDDTLIDIAMNNNDIFAVKTDGGSKVTLFDRISENITDTSKRDNFCRALINNLVHSIQNIIQGNTMLHPYHKDGSSLKKFDYIVSNPPFKMDFSDFRDDLDSKENHERFFAGLPNVPKKAKDKMAIYQLFLQHIIYSLKPNGKAAVVVPTGFITAQSGIAKKIRKKLVDEKMLAGVVSMPSNIFATTGTNVSIVFIDKENQGDVVLIDASNLGETIKDGKNQKTVLTEAEEQQITHTFNSKEAVDDFSVVVSYADIQNKNYSLSAGQYFEVKIEYTDITHEEFEAKMKGFTDNLDTLFAESKALEVEIKKQLAGLKYDF